MHHLAFKGQFETTKIYTLGPVNGSSGSFIISLNEIDTTLIK